MWVIQFLIISTLVCSFNLLSFSSFIFFVTHVLLSSQTFPNLSKPELERGIFNDTREKFDSVLLSGIEGLVFFHDFPNLEIDEENLETRACSLLLFSCIFYSFRGIFSLRVDAVFNFIEFKNFLKSFGFISKIEFRIKIKVSFIKPLKISKYFIALGIMNFLLFERFLYMISFVCKSSS